MKRSPKVAGIGKECVACGCCAAVCPRDALYIASGVTARLDEDKCVGCGKCTKSLSGRRYFHHRTEGCAVKQKKMV